MRKLYFWGYWNSMNTEFHDYCAMMAFGKSPDKHLSLFWKDWRLTSRGFPSAREALGYGRRLEKRYNRFIRSLNG